MIVEDEEQPEYGGGLCGASTALYQGTLTNTALAPTEWKPHTKRYTNLYTASINDEKISTPGIDSTIYDGYVDLEVHNTATYPIILVLNYDGSYGGTEEVFSLAKTTDLGSYEFQSKRYTSSTIRTKTGGTQRVNGGCYNRLINGEERQSCYKEVN